MEQLKLRSNPGASGLAADLLLIASFFLTRFSVEHPTLRAINFVILFIVLCCEIHQIRMTSSLFNEHVWENRSCVFLWLIPVFNLFVVFMQFFGTAFVSVFNSGLFTLFVIVFSQPLFFACYFVYVTQKFRLGTAFKIPAAVSFVLACLYIVLRVADKIVMPMIAVEKIPSFISALISYNPTFTIVIYAIGLVFLSMLTDYFRKNCSNNP